MSCGARSSTKSENEKEGICARLCCCCQRNDTDDEEEEEEETGRKGKGWTKVASKSKSVRSKGKNGLQHNAMQCNAIQCNATQSNAIQCNAVQYNTVHSAAYLQHCITFLYSLRSLSDAISDCRRSHPFSSESFYLFIHFQLSLILPHYSPKFEVMPSINICNNLYHPISSFFVSSRQEE